MSKRVKAAALHSEVLHPKYHAVGVVNNRCSSRCLAVTSATVKHKP